MVDTLLVLRATTLSALTNTGESAVRGIRTHPYERGIVDPSPWLVPSSPVGLPDDSANIVAPQSPVNRKWGVHAESHCGRV